jgi:hypothetical protein
VAYFVFIILGTVITLFGTVKRGYHLTLKKLVRKIVNEEYLLYLLLNIIFGGLFSLYFAKCGGDGEKYCRDILAVSCFLLFIYVWVVYSGRCMASEKNHQIVYSIILITVCVASVVTYSRFGNTVYTNEDVDEYKALNNVISEYAGETIYLGMNSTQYLLNEDVWEPDNVYFNDGQVEYFAEEFPSLDNFLINAFFYEEEVKNAAVTYRKKVNEMVKNKEFALITTCLDQYFIDMEQLEQNYDAYGTFNIKTYTDTREVTVWSPKK